MVDLFFFVISFVIVFVVLVNWLFFLCVIFMLCMVVFKGILVEVDFFFFLKNFFLNCISFF